MNCRQLNLLLSLSYCSWCLARGAQVYMEFNGQKYAYNTDAAVQSSDLSPNYESQHWSAAQNRISQSNQWGWTTSQREEVTAQAAPSQPPQPPQPQKQPLNIDFSTQHMSHTQHTDESGIVLGKYSYYDAAGYHDLSYKAGAGIGFVVMGGNLAKPTQQSDIQTVANLHSY